MTFTTDIIDLQQISLRFIHASDLHLERTIEGVAESPGHWEERMLDVSKRAAQRLFQKCIDEAVDFLILSGNVVHAQLAPPGIFLFLLEQFERLQKAGIAVYWAGGELDSPEDMPHAFPMPDNVHRFPSNTIQEFYVHRKAADEQRVEHTSDTLPIAKLVGMSRNQHTRRIRSSAFPSTPGGVFSIAVANGDVEPETLSQRYIDYWAMGGSNYRQTVQGNVRNKRNEQPAEGRERKEIPPPYIVHYPGATLARTPADIDQTNKGRYGATLVEVILDESGRPVEAPTLTSFSTSPIRWVEDCVVLEASDDAVKLADELRERLKSYREISQRGADDLLINWLIDIPPGPLAHQLRRSGLAQDLLSEHRALYSQDDPMTWSVSISVLVPDQLPKIHYEQQTILGDFLRSVKHFQDNPQEIIHLGGYIPKHWSASVESSATITQPWEDESARQNIIQQMLFAEKVKDEIVDAEDKEAKERWVQSSDQSKTQQQVLCESAMTGIELFSR